MSEIFILCLTNKLKIWWWITSEGFSWSMLKYSMNATQMNACWERGDWYFTTIICHACNRLEQNTYFNVFILITNSISFRLLNIRNNMIFYLTFSLHPHSLPSIFSFNGTPTLMFKQFQNQIQADLVKLNYLLSFLNL